MRTIHRPMTDLAQYARVLRTYTATLTDATGTVVGTCRELYAGGSVWLEWRAMAYWERFLVRRSDMRLTLGEVA